VDVGIFPDWEQRILKTAGVLLLKSDLTRTGPSGIVSTKSNILIIYDLEILGWMKREIKQNADVSLGGLCRS
jgi:hypothetical protein